MQCNRKKVVVQGQGFVGLIMSLVVANAVDDNDRLLYRVTGLEKKQDIIKKIKAGVIPITTVDTDVLDCFEKARKLNKNYTVTDDRDVLQSADIVIVDINLDIKKNKNSYVDSELNLNMFKEGLREVGTKISPETLVIIETTVPFGLCEKIAEPLLREEFANRGITVPPQLAYSYERVMPGKHYIKSITHNYRTYSANSETARLRAEQFFETIIDTDNYSLRYLNRMTACEFAKILENSYRAVNIALIYEWTLAAEQAGINLFEVIESIQVRKGTHDNMMKPGFGVGGYCLPKDSLLGQWALKNIFNSDINLDFAIKAIEVNDKMPLHTFDLLQDVMPELRDKKILLFGVSYLAGVDDTRNSPTKILYDKLREKEAHCYLYDPYARDYDNFAEEDYLTGIPDDYKEFDAVFFLVRHQEFMDYDIELIAETAKRGIVVIDAFNILNDDKIIKLLEKGLVVKGVGKGHIDKLI